MPRRHTLARQMPRPQSNTVSVNFKVDANLKADFERALTKHGRFKDNTHFWVACMEAFVLQSRRGEKPLFPVEFVHRA